MRLRRVRFTVRLMMLAIASVAILLWARSEVERLLRRRAYFLGKAEVLASRRHDCEVGNMCLKDKWYGRGLTEQDRWDYIVRLGNYYGETDEGIGPLHLIPGSASSLNSRGQVTIMFRKIVTEQL